MATVAWPTIAPVTGLTLAALARYRPEGMEPPFGVSGEAAEPGRVARGDPVEPL